MVAARRTSRAHRLAKLSPEPTRGTLTDPCGLDSLTSEVVRGAHLAQVCVADGTPDDEHSAERGRAERCRAGPAGNVPPVPAREGGELTAVVPELRHFLANLGAGIGALLEDRNVRGWRVAVHHRSAVLPQSRLEHGQLHRGSVRLYRLVVLRTTAGLGVGMGGLCGGQQQAAERCRQSPESSAANRHGHTPWLAKVRSIAQVAPQNHGKGQEAQPGAQPQTAGTPRLRLARLSG